MTTMRSANLLTLASAPRAEAFSMIAILAEGVVGVIAKAPF